MNVLARELGTGPLKLLKDKSLDQEKETQKKSILDSYTDLVRANVWNLQRVEKVKEELQKGKLCHVGQWQWNCSRETVIVHSPVSN